MTAINLFTEDKCVGVADILGTVHCHEGGEVMKNKMYIRVSAGDATFNEVKYGLRMLFKKRCSCEHDCCAHWFGGVSNIQYKEGLYVVDTTYYRNI
jgi:hypothetical protein